MMHTIHELGTIEPGGVVRIKSGDLAPAGTPVEITLVFDDATPNARPEAVEERFQRLAQIWRAETKYLSSTTAICMNAAYQGIIGMGPAAIPLILAELRSRPGHWYWALQSITGENPIPPEAHGKIGKIAEAWLQWGRDHGYAC